MFKKLFLLSIIFSTLLFAQRNGTVIGIITDSLTNQILSNTNITIEKSTIGTISNSKGNFSLSLPFGTYTLHYSRVGYKTFHHTITINKDSLLIEILLSPSEIQYGEVTVTGTVAHITPLAEQNAIAISTKEIKNISGAFGDVFKSLQGIAGAVSNNETSSQINVRGGLADENLILLNGAEVLEPFHLKEAPNTSLTVFNPDILQQLLFIPGGFTARYGDRLSAVIDLKYREGNTTKWSGSINGSLTDVSALIEGPIVENTISNLLSIRSTYYNGVAKYLTAGEYRNPNFYDVQNVLHWKISPTDKINFLTLYTADNTTGLSNGNYGSLLTALSSEHTFSPDITLYNTLSYYSQYDDIELGQTNIKNLGKKSTTNNFDISTVEIKSRIEKKWNNIYSTVAGIEIQQPQYNLFKKDIFYGSSGDSITFASFYNNEIIKVGSYIENQFRFSEIFVNAGLREDYFSLTEEIKISPRLLLTYQYDNLTRWKFSWGIYYQTPTYRQLLSSSQQKVLPQTMQQAIHYVFGLDKILRHDLNYRVELYYKDLSNLISFQRLRSGEIVYSAKNDAKGRIYGVDIEGMFSDERVMGWINFNLMYAQEKKSGEGWRSRATDQRKTATAIFEYRGIKNFLWNLRAFYGSGFPYLDDSPGTIFYVWDHYPEYKRIDVRLSYFFKFYATTTTTFLEVMNLYSNRNTLSFTGEAPNNIPERNLLLPMTINVGVKFEW